MAKFKPNFKKLQREMLERMEKQRKNRNNWTSISIGLKTPKDILDANDFYYESIRAKTHKKNLKKC